MTYELKLCPLGSACSSGGLSFTVTLLAANLTTLGWLGTYHLLLDPPEVRAQQLWRHDSDGGAAAANSRPPRAPLIAEAAAVAAAAAGQVDEEEGQRLLDARTRASSNEQQRQQEQRQPEGDGSPGKPSRAARMTVRERLYRTGAAGLCAGCVVVRPWCFWDSTLPVTNPRACARQPPPAISFFLTGPR